MGEDKMPPHEEGTMTAFKDEKSFTITNVIPEVPKQVSESYNVFFCILIFRGVFFGK